MPPFSAPAASASKNNCSSRAAPSSANRSKENRQKHILIWNNFKSEQRRGERMLCPPQQLDAETSSSKQVNPREGRRRRRPGDHSSKDGRAGEGGQAQGLRCGRAVVAPSCWRSSGRAAHAESIPVGRRREALHRSGEMGSRGERKRGGGVRLTRRSSTTAARRADASEIRCLLRFAIFVDDGRRRVGPGDDGWRRAALWYDGRQRAGLVAHRHARDAEKKRGRTRGS
jgi:hypothetical protein